MLIIDRMRQLMCQDEPLFQAESTGPLVHEPAGVGVVEPDHLARQERAQRCAEVHTRWDHADRAPGGRPAVVVRLRIGRIEALLDQPVHLGTVDRSHRDGVLVEQATHVFDLVLDIRDLGWGPAARNGRPAGSLRRNAQLLDRGLRGPRTAGLDRRKRDWCARGNPARRTRRCYVRRRRAGDGREGENHERQVASNADHRSPVGHTTLATAATIAATDIQTDSQRSRVEARNPRADTANVNPAAAIKRNPTT